MIMQEFLVRLEQIEREEAQWEHFFLRSAIDPCVVEYEALVANYKELLRAVLDFLKVHAPAHIEASGIQRQADELNTQWETRYRSECNFKCD